MLIMLRDCFVSPRQVSLSLTKPCSQQGRLSARLSSAQWKRRLSTEWDWVYLEYSLFYRSELVEMRWLLSQCPAGDHEPGLAPVSRSRSQSCSVVEETVLRWEQLQWPGSRDTLAWPAGGEEEHCWETEDTWYTHHREEQHCQHQVSTDSLC